MRQCVPVCNTHRQSNGRCFVFLSSMAGWLFWGNVNTVVGSDYEAYSGATCVCGVETQKRLLEMDE